MSPRISIRIPIQIPNTLAQTLPQLSQLVPSQTPLNRCLPLWMRPFLTVREEAQVGQAGMSRREGNKLYSYIITS